MKRMDTAPMAVMANQRKFQAALPVLLQRAQMTMAVTATSAPQRMSGLPEFLAIVRRLRSMVSAMRRRLFSAEKLFSIFLTF